MNSSDRRSYEIARLILQKLEENPDAVFDIALRNIERWRKGSGRHPHLDEWARIIGRGPGAVRSVLSDRTDQAQELRSSAPFAGVLSESERREAIAHAALPAPERSL